MPLPNRWDKIWPKIWPARRGRSDPTCRNQCPTAQTKLGPPTTRSLTGGARFSATRQRYRSGELWMQEQLKYRKARAMHGVRGPLAPEGLLEANVVTPGMVTAVSLE